MNIMIAVWSLEVGGGEILALNLAAGLAAKGHTVFVFNQRAHLFDKALVQRLLPPSVRVLSMVDRSRRSFIAYKLDAIAQRLGQASEYFERAQSTYLAWCLKRYQIDLVHSHATYSDRMCLPVTQAANVPLIITEHGEYAQFTREGLRDFLPVLRGARIIAAVSDYCRKTMMDYLTGLPPVATVYNGVVLHPEPEAGRLMKQQLGIPAQAFVFGMAARGRPDKGWQCAIDAFQQLRASSSLPVYLVLVGGSEYLDQLQLQYAADADIIFTGRVSNPDFYLAGIDVGLLPTYFAAEALPLVIIEYMVSGKPTIATRVGGIPELLASGIGDTGQLLEMDASTKQPDCIALAIAMKRYLEEPILYATHAKNALEAAEEYFTMPTCVAHYERLYADALVTR